jgi:threonine dehydratase
MRISNREHKNQLPVFHFGVIEGAVALSIASFMKVRQRYNNKNVVLLITAKKISLNTLKKVLCNGGLKK